MCLIDLNVPCLGMNNSSQKKLDSKDLFNHISATPFFTQKTQSPAESGQQTLERTLEAAIPEAG
jgi:hypothetical protein